jgi:hypothetical protein
MIDRHLTPDQLRAKAKDMRQEAQYTRAVLDSAPPMHRAGLRARAERMERLAGELERAAQRAEAVGA